MVWADVLVNALKELEAGKIFAITGAKNTPVRTIVPPLHKTDGGRLHALRDLILQYPGPQPLYLRFRSKDGQELKLKADSGYCVRDAEEFRLKLAELLG